MCCYPVCHGSITETFLVTIKMEKVSVKIWFLENLKVHNLVKGFLKCVFT